MPVKHVHFFLQFSAQSLKYTVTSQGAARCFLGNVSSSTHLEGDDLGLVHGPTPACVIEKQEEQPN